MRCQRPFAGLFPRDFRPLAGLENVWQPDFFFVSCGAAGHRHRLLAREASGRSSVCRQSGLIGEGGNWNRFTWDTNVCAQA